MAGLENWAASRLLRRAFGRCRATKPASRAARSPRRGASVVTMTVSIAVAALASRHAEGIGLAMHGGVCLLNEPIVASSEQPAVLVEQRGTDRDSAFARAQTRFVDRHREQGLIRVRHRGMAQWGRQSRTVAIAGVNRPSRVLTHGSQRAERLQTAQRRAGIGIGRQRRVQVHVREVALQGVGVRIGTPTG